MAKPVINNYEDLMLEKQRLKSSLRKKKAKVNETFEALKEEVNPFSAIQKTAGAALQTNASNPLIKMGINKATDLLVGKVFLKNAGWLPKMLVPLLVKEITSRVVGHKPDKRIVAMLRKTAASIRSSNFPDLSDFSKKSKI